MRTATLSVRWGGAILPALAILAGARPALAGHTPAGTILTSTAQAIYYDGTPRQVDLDSIAVTVAPRPSATVKLAQKSGAVSGTAAFPCAITNDSNYANGVRLTVTMTMNTYAYLTPDTNGDGVWQPEENAVLRSIPSLAAGETVHCFLLVRAMPGTPDGATGGVTVLAAPVDSPDQETSAAFTPTFLMPQITPAFEFQAPAPIASSPTVRDGLAIFGTDAGVLYAVRAQGAGAGTQVWRFPESGGVGAPIRGRVAADTTGYYFTANNGKAYKLDPTGQPLWETQVVPEGIEMEAMPILTDQFVMLACGDGRVRRMDKSTGILQDESPIVGNGRLTTPAVPQPGDMWVGGADGSLYNLADGNGFTVISSHPISGQPMSATPFVDAKSGLVMSVTYEGNVYAMQMHSDVVVWGPKSLGSPVTGSPWVNSAAGIAYFASNDSTLYALYVKDGSPVPGYPVRLTEGGGFENSPVVTPLGNGEATLFAASDAGKFYALNAANPAHRLVFDTGDPTAQFLGAPALSGPTLNDVVVAAATNGKLYGFQVQDVVVP